MYRISINHKSGDPSEITGIDRVEYFIAGMEQVIEGKDIGTHKFPTSNNLYLFSSSEKYTCSINGDDISSIIVESED